jgi:hypothetical protein
VEFVAEFAAQIFIRRERAEFGGAELVLLQFREQRAQFLREAGPAGAAAQQFQGAVVLPQQGAQHHQPAFGGQEFRRREMEFFKNKTREPVEGKNLQPREAGNFFIGEQLAFELKRGLLGREQNQRRTIGRLRQRGADSGEAAEGLAAAGGPEEESRLHAAFLTQRRQDAKPQRNLFHREICERRASWREINPWRKTQMQENHFFGFHA